MNRYGLTDKDLLYMYAEIGIKHYHRLSEKTQREKMEWLERMIRKVLVERDDLEWLLEHSEYDPNDYIIEGTKWKQLKEKYEK